MISTESLSCFTTRDVFILIATALLVVTLATSFSPPRKVVLKGSTALLSPVQISPVPTRSKHTDDFSLASMGHSLLYTVRTRSRLLCWYTSPDDLVRTYAPDPRMNLFANHVRATNIGDWIISVFMIGRWASDAVGTNGTVVVSGRIWKHSIGAIPSPEELLDRFEAPYNTTVAVAYDFYIRNADYAMLFEKERERSHRRVTMSTEFVAARGHMDGFLMSVNHTMYNHLTQHIVVPYWSPHSCTHRTDFLSKVEQARRREYLLSFAGCVPNDTYAMGEHAVQRRLGFEVRRMVSSVFNELGRDDLHLHDPFCSRAETLFDARTSRSSAHGTEEIIQTIHARSTFCFAIGGDNNGCGRLYDVLYANCIPVIVDVAHPFPFETDFPWDHIMIMAPLRTKRQVHDLIRRLETMSEAEVARRRSLIDMHVSKLMWNSTCSPNAYDMIAKRLWPLRTGTDTRFWLHEDKSVTARDWRATLSRLRRFDDSNVVLHRVDWRQAQRAEAYSRDDVFKIFSKV